MKKDSRVPGRGSPWAKRTSIALFVVLVVLPLVTVAIASTRLFRPGGRVLEIEMLAKGGRFAQIFWSADFAMSPNDSSLAMLHQRPGVFDTLRFPLPQTPLEVLRLDPLDGEGEVVIRRMRVVDSEGRAVRIIDPMVFLPLHQIAIMKPEPDGVRVVTAPGANDPMLVAKSSWLVATPAWYDLQFVTPFSLAWVALAVFALIGAGLAVVVKDIRAGPRWRQHALWFGALFLGIVWAKLALLDHFPVPVPFWDQWDGEGLTLYVPWADHGVTWRQMFTFHNEHRIFFSRLLSLCEFVINGQWDPHLQITVNAMVHALAGFVFAAALWLVLERRYLPVVVVAVLVTFGAPFGIENSLNGFQSAFYFLVLFSALAIFLMGTSRPGTARWFLGCVFALCCPFTVAGGILVLPAIAVTIVLGTIGEGWGWRAVGLSVVALGVIAVVGYSALPPPIAAHEALRAGSFFHFRVALARSLAFPFINYPRATALMWLPMAILGLSIAWRRLRARPSERFALAMGVWIVLQCLAMAYSRGVNGGAPASRYLDVVALGYLANTAVILSWLEPRRGQTFLAAGVGALVVWLLVTGFGIKRVSDEAVAAHGPVRQQWTREHIKNIRQFVVTDDVKSFLELKGPRDIPYHSAALLASWLEHPVIRRILPTAVRQPLDIGGTAVSQTSTSGSPNPQPVFDSYSLGHTSGVARFEGSTVACSSFSHLWFELASSSRWNGLRVSLEGNSSSSVVEMHRPWFALGGWTGIAVRCPSGPFKVVAEDSSPTSWVAFRQPAEIAVGSAAIAWLVPRSNVIGFIALTLTVAAVVVSATTRKRNAHGSFRGETPLRGRFSDNGAGVSS